MPCYSPLQGWRSKTPTKNGKYPVVFNRSQGCVDLPVSVPCGQCIGCRIKKSKEWAVRCMHEMSMHTHNSFVTLTYADENLPSNGSLVKSDFQNFIKRLRKRTDAKLRYYGCGEYGEVTNRPHYHIIIFGYDFPDKVYHGMSGENKLFTSPLLDSIWKHGHAIIGNVTYQSIFYVSKYVHKKITGKLAPDHYGDLVPEFALMSLKPAIGREWFDKYSSDVFPDDFCVLQNGKKVAVPNYYFHLLERELEDEAKKIKIDRKVSADDHADNNTLRRLRDRETFAQAVLNQKQPSTQGV